jgi:hypothetical protein
MTSLDHEKRLPRCSWKNEIAERRRENLMDDLAQALK